MAQRQIVAEPVRPTLGTLADTSYAILGILTFGEMSGYDVGKMAQRTVAQFCFKPAKSQIYAELRRLVSAGYATDRAVTQESRPDKRLYVITGKGREALQCWLETSEVGPDIVRSPLYLRVFFGGLMDRTVLIAQVQDGLRQSKENLARFQQLAGEIEGRPDCFFPSLVLRRGLAHERASIRWATEVLRELQSQDEGATPLAESPSSRLRERSDEWD